MFIRSLIYGSLVVATLMGCAAQPDVRTQSEVGAIDQSEQNFYQAMTELHAVAESGDAAARRQYLQRIDSNMALSNAPMMFAAAQFALMERSIERAAYLFYAGRLRIAADRYAYGLSDPNVNDILDNMASAVGAQINPLIMQRPGEYATVVKQLYAWDMTRGEGYDPGWSGEAQLSAAEQSKQQVALKTAALSEMDALVFLLNIPAYHQAFMTVQSYNRLSEQDRAIEENIGIAQQAMAVMSDIEAREGVYVFTQPSQPR